MILLSILLITLFATGLGLALMALGVNVDSPYLLVHIVTAATAYAAFAVALIYAWLYLHSERRLRSQRLALLQMPLLSVERLMFVWVYAGFTLLSISLFFGGFAGGTEFLLKWQHKTVFALMAWLCFVALVLGRWLLGWRAAKAVRMVHFGSVFLLLAYVGSHFVLQVILKRGVS